MVIQVKTVITLGGKRHRLGGSRREPSGALRMFFYTLTWVIGNTVPTNGKIHYGYTEIWAPYNLKNITILSLNKFLKKLMDFSIGSHNRN